MTALKAPLTLYCSVTSLTELNYWNDSDGNDDPFVGSCYQWQAIISVVAQNTGDFTNNFSYTETDIVVGDWLVMASQSPTLSLKIVGINSAAGGIIDCIVEDVDRYNLHNYAVYGANPTSNFGVNDGLIVRLGEDGLPIWNGLIPYSIPVTTTEEINSRFRYRNYLLNNYRIQQVDNGFAIGDEISLTSDGTYVLASAIGTAAYKVIGRVKDINIPTDGYFTFEPKGKLSRYLTPSLPGDPGDIIYLDPLNPGKLTDTKPTNGIAVPIFIKINNSTGVKLDEVLPSGLDNFSGTAPPTANDDSGDGYSYGSIWVDTVNKKSYINVDPSVGASIWQLIGSGDGGGGTGYTGSVGYTGSRGETGYVGSQGILGYTGSMGPQGPAGGYTGSRGEVGYTGSSSIANATTQSFAGTGSQTQFTLNISMTNQNNAIVTINGIVQYPTLHYTIAGNVLTFTFAPYLNSSIEVRNLEHGTGGIGYTGSSGYTGSAAQVNIASESVLGIVQIGDNINVTPEGVISVTKGAGINKLVDVPDVISDNLSEGSYLSYRENLERWEASTLGAIYLDGGNY